MKTDTRMILAPLAALAVAFGAYAFSPQSENFESYAEGTAATNVTKFCSIGSDESAVAAADGNKYLNVSTDEGTLFRSINDLNNGGIGTAATVGAYGIDVDMSIKFTVTAAGDEPEFSAGDKLSLWLQAGDGVTNLMARGGLYAESAGTYTSTSSTGAIYKLTGVTVTPGEWTSVKLKAIANVNNTGIPGFEVWVGDTPQQATVALADGTSSPLGVSTAVPSMSSTAELAAVGFSGNGAVDDISIVDNATAGTVIQLVSDVTSTEANGVYTFTAPAGSVIGSLLVNGNLVSAAAGQTSYDWTSVPGASVVVAATKPLTAAEHPWYENPGAVVLAENLPQETGANIVSLFHGQGQEDYLGLTFGTRIIGFNLYTVDGTDTPTVIKSVAYGTGEGQLTADLRGVAISKTLGLALVGNYYPMNDSTAANRSHIYAFPLDGGEPTEVNLPETHAFDSAAFSPDGKYLFSNNIKGETANTYYVKWSVAVTNGEVTLTKVGSIAASGRGRNLAYARIGERDLVFAMVDAGKVDVLDMTGDTTGSWTSNSLVTGLLTHSYGSLCVSGVKATGATPTLTVAASCNGAGRTNDVLNVYTLTVPASGTVTASLEKSFNIAALTAAGFGENTNGHGNTVYVTDDNATIYYGRNNRTLYAGQYAVASIYNTLYTNFTEAVSAITNEDDYVTLFADASLNMVAGYTLRVKTNGHNFTVEHADNVIVGYSTDANNVTTYTATGAIATITKNGVTTPYATLQAALSAADADQDVDTVNLIAAPSGEVAIPAGVLVAVPSSLVTGTTFSGITSLVGPGTIRLENGFPPNALCSLLKNSVWNGTLEIYNLNASGYPLYLTNYGNVNSTIRLNQILNATLSSDFQNFTGTLEVGALGWTVTGSFNEIVLPSKLTGSGPITVGTTPASGSTASTLRFTGDVSGFTGNISFGSGSNARVAFGNNKAGSASTIYVNAGTTVTNAAGATWTADKVMVAGGELVANGTVNGTLQGLSASGYTGGRYVANATTAAITADSSWTGTYVVGWNPGAADTAFDINNYGTAANATIQIDGVNGEFSAFPREGTTVANVTAKIVLNANWSIGDGWNGKTNTFAYLSGSGNISASNVTDYSYGRIFNIKELDNYTGTLGGYNGQFIVDKVNVTTAPAEGARVVATAIGTYGSINSDIPLWVGGVDSGDVLEYKADGANGAGLYVKASTPDIPVVSPGTNTVYNCGSAENATTVASTINGAPADYIKAPAAANIADDTPAVSAYANLFAARADGSDVVLELTAAGTNALETAATNAAAQVAGQLSTIVAASEATTVTVAGVQPGFYYTVVYDDNLATLDTAGTESAPAVAGAAGSVTLNIPAKESGATAGFYRVKVYVTNPQP